MITESTVIKVTGQTPGENYDVVVGRGLLAGFRPCWGNASSGSSSFIPAPSG